MTTRRKATRDHNSSRETWLKYWTTRNVVPAFNQNGWRNVTTFNASTGSVRRATASPGDGMTAFVPGLLEGHQYKITIVCSEVDDTWNVTNNDAQTFGTISAVGTTILMARVQVSNRLKFAYAGGTTGSLTITSLIVEAMDGVDPALFPAP